MWGVGRWENKAAFCLLPFAFCLLPFAFCLLPPACCPLPLL
ncbi:apolipoprotein N-acyltransferase [Microcystis aeruginosa NIES-44]|uniref:Apolipoprotein N-acyltransferase n=1 Tax=Microcystis aeruginosa NIES-44 TaxID=449439 RepID=A0A0A1VSX7_MICAE|nr:apolipoprotein N-acyltransferase [Microcystis aeruginosa NIES-44]